MHLSYRLKTIANYIFNNTRLIDVGTDHALLPIYLIQKKLCNHITAIDNKSGPLEIAKKNILKYNLANQITLIRNDGFRITNIKDFNTVVIAGLGAAQINDIVNRDDINSIQRYILISTHWNNSLLREWVKNKNYFIEDEKIILDKGIYYELIIINKQEGSKVISQSDLNFGPINLKTNKKIFHVKWNLHLQCLENKLQQFGKFHNNKWKINILNQIQLIKDNCNESK